MTTINHPAHGPVSLDRLHQIREILSKASAQSDGGNLGYAMADAVKVIDGAIAARNAKPLAWTDAEELRDLERDGCGAMLSLNRKDCEHADPRRQILLFTHPAPLRNAEREELEERRKADSEAQATLKRLAVIIHGSEVDLNLLTVTAQSLMDRCKAGNSPVIPDGSTCKYCGGTGYFRWQQSENMCPCPCVGCDQPTAPKPRSGRS